jgi:pimeloyl-ACP methyl ester carboxylesterase
MMLLECPQRIRRIVLVSSGGLGREIAMSLRLASIPRIVERFGQPFMGAGTRLALKGAGGIFSKKDIARLSAINSQSGSARAFARTVQDVIGWRGQRRSFLERPGELVLPPLAVFWGDRDAIIPISHAKSLVESMDEVRLTVFEGCGHYLHHQQPDAFVKALRGFLDDPSVLAARARRPARAPQVPGPILKHARHLG